MDNASVELPSEYILFVGSRFGYKNFEKFLKAVKNIVSLYSSYHVVCTGGGEFSESEKILINKLGLENRIHQYNVNDEEMPVYYSKAQLFVFPSLYEGFGMPILEAFACGCPTLLSNSSCFPEIAEKAALYFDPNDVDSMITMIIKVIESEELRKNMVAKGYERVKYFTWDETEKQTYSVYLSLKNNIRR
jgi:glycosyltransferase involved in cell wall biosynthesis